MSTDPKAQPQDSPAPAAPTPPPVKKTQTERGIMIFTYPKIIFMFPTLVVTIICAIGMGFSNHFTPSSEAVNNFKSAPNMLGLLFLMTLFFNLLIIAIDFPRFTVVAIALFGTTALFFLLWLGMYFDVLAGLAKLLSGIYVEANAGFYVLLAIVLGLVYGVIFITRWLDYWEILPNEILHHHGPWSDLERFPTMNLKFDKEIPDIFEHFMFRSGRLVLRVPSEGRSIVLDNVLHVGKVESRLKQLMSRMEVRVTTDQEVER